jgi:hypothetical protein
MTLTIHLGVVDVPYATEVPAEQRRTVHRTTRGGETSTFTAAPSGGETTGDVAQMLEDEYHVMEVFYEDVGEELIAKALEHSVVGAIRDLIAGKPTSLVEPFAKATAEMEAAFKMFLSQQEMDGVVGGVPTKASLNGVNHRLAHPYAKGNPSRPSFIDTGTYESHFKVEVEST